MTRGREHLVAARGKRAHAALLVAAVANVKAVLVPVAHHGVSCGVVESAQIENLVAGFEDASARLRRRAQQQRNEHGQ